MHQAYGASQVETWHPGTDQICQPAIFSFSDALTSIYSEISKSVVISYFLDSITCFISYILSSLYLSYNTWLFRYLGSFVY